MSKTLEQYKERFESANSALNGSEIYRMVLGNLPAFPFDRSITVERHVFSALDSEGYDIFYYNYSDGTTNRDDTIRRVVEFGDNVFGTGSRCYYMSQGNKNMKKVIGMDWCALYTLCLANLMSNENAKALVIYALTAFAVLTTPAVEESIA